MQFAITDITRFGNGNIVCTAGIDLDTNRCVRPVSPNYIATSRIIDDNIKVGDILSSPQMSPIANPTLPHVEDQAYRTPLVRVGELSRNQLKALLLNTLSDSVNDGFENRIIQNDKYIPIHTPPSKSLITVRVSRIELVSDQYRQDKVRVIFTDMNNIQYRFISLTDFWLLRELNNSNQDLRTYNSRLNNSEVLLRIGIGRPFEPIDGKNGYWLQVNSIITFES